PFGRVPAPYTVRGSRSHDRPLPHGWAVPGVAGRAADPRRRRPRVSGAAYDGEWVVSSVLDDRAEVHGATTFVTSVDGDLTYGGLRERASRVAGGLAALGVQPGDRVATMLDPTIDYLAAWFGIVWAG